MPDTSLSALHGFSHLGFTTILESRCYQYLSLQLRKLRLREVKLLTKVRQLVRVETRISAPAG